MTFTFRSHLSTIFCAGLIFISCASTKPVETCLYQNNSVNIQNCETPVYFLFAHPDFNKLSVFDLIKVNNATSGTLIEWNNKAGAIIEDIVIRFHGDSLFVYSESHYNQEIDGDNRNPQHHRIAQFEKRGLKSLDVNRHYLIYDNYEDIPEEVRNRIDKPIIDKSKVDDINSTNINRSNSMKFGSYAKSAIYPIVNNQSTTIFEAINAGAVKSNLEIEPSNLGSLKEIESVMRHNTKIIEDIYSGLQTELYNDYIARGINHFNAVRMAYANLELRARMEQVSFGFRTSSHKQVAELWEKALEELPNGIQSSYLKAIDSNN